MSEYTPTTEEVRSAAATLNMCRYSEFDRWLAEVERASAEKAWDEACRDTEQYYKRTVVGIPGVDPIKAPMNPYRREDA
ncbi:hypothetical protein MUN76_15250 [Leucobacter rhizosphaerae]|uniref:Uncharacterized protein n=1 Tax=Leucobacter rhizosphaerae TaxID=2932245 RepID=A0ABY4FVM4_9MICO|nr:hypothetical protein [Leucobacter rhizosphaerae]UOQ60365.1 hypothetical protein MUN76_15250 [Leucobacter rhizosphaerae]